MDEIMGPLLLFVAALVVAVAMIVFVSFFSVRTDVDAHARPNGVVEAESRESYSGSRRNTGRGTWRSTDMT